MNVGIVTTWFERGAAYVSRSYMNVLSEKHDVFIYARGEKYAEHDPTWNIANVTLGKFTIGKPLTHVDWSDFVKWVTKNKLDIVIFNEQHSWDVIIQIHKSKLNILIGAYIDYYTPQTVPFYWLYDFLLCNTKRHYEVFQTHDNAIYLPWGTEVDIFNFDSEYINSQTDKPIIFFHSCGWSPIRKGTDLTIKAFTNIKGNAKLVIHAQDSINKLFKVDWPKYETRFTVKAPTIEQLLSESHNQIEVIEKEVGAPGLYHLGDVYVYPSRLDGIGLTLAEALSCGLPVIATDSPPMSEFIKDRVNGRKVKVSKFRTRTDNYFWPISTCCEKSLTEAMQFYIDNRQNLDRYKRDAREYAVANLDWKRNSKQFCEIIQRVSVARTSDGELLHLVEKYEQERKSHSSFMHGLRYLITRSVGGRVRKYRKGS